MAAKLALSRKVPKVDDAIVEIEKAVKSSKRVAAWGAYALTRVQREKRNKKNVNIAKIIQSVVNELEPHIKLLQLALIQYLKIFIHIRFKWILKQF